MGLTPQALSGDQSPDPIFASRRFKSSLLNDAHARRKFKLIDTGAKRKKGAGNKVPCWGLGIGITRRCAGFSVMEIGNRKKRFAFLYEFPGSKPHTFPFSINSLSRSKSLFCRKGIEPPRARATQCQGFSVFCCPPGRHADYLPASVMTSNNTYSATSGAGSCSTAPALTKLSRWSS